MEETKRKAIGLERKGKRATRGNVGDRAGSKPEGKTQLEEKDEWEQEGTAQKKGSVGGEM